MTSTSEYDVRPWRPFMGIAVAFVLATALLLPHTATAAESTGNTATLAAGAATVTKISREQATQAALTALPGEVTDVTIERKHGKMVYVIEIVAKKNGAETDVLVDMDSGKVLGME